MQTERGIVKSIQYENYRTELKHFKIYFFNFFIN